YFAYIFSDSVATVPVLQNPKPSRKRKQKLHPTRSKVLLEVPDFEPVEKIKVKVKRRPWAKRDYMDKSMFFEYFYRVLNNSSTPSTHKLLKDISYIIQKIN
ncbi:unnamed protein product, partial [Owenia fusiformis]